LFGGVFRDRRGRTALITLYGYTFLRGAGRASFFFLYPLYLVSIGYSLVDIGTIATISSALIILILPLVGYFVDHGWSFEILLLSGLSLALSLLIPPFIHTYSFLVLAYMLNMLSLFLWSPSRNKIIGVLVPENLLGRIYSLFVILFNSSRTLMPFILGRLTSVYGYTYLMLIIGIFMLIGSIIVYIPLYGLRGIFRRKSISRSDLINSYKSMFMFDHSILPIIMFSLIDSFAWRLWFPLINAYLKEYRGFSDSVIGDFNTVFGLSMLITSYIAGAITDYVKPIKALILYELMGASGIMIVNLPYPYIYISAVMLGFSIAFWVSAYNTFITIVYGVEKIGRLRVVTDSARNLSGIPAPQIGGFLMSINPLITFTSSALLMFLAIMPLKTIRSRFKGV
jgi:DHA1 family multidrug resistance protein-like MFS transporter